MKKRQIARLPEIYNPNFPESQQSGVEFQIKTFEDIKAFVYNVHTWCIYCIV